MSIHIFCFADNKPSVDEQVSRLQKTLLGFVFSDPHDIQNIADFLFVRRYDTSILLKGYKVLEITVNKTKSKYEFGSLTTLNAGQKSL